MMELDAFFKLLRQGNSIRRRCVAEYWEKKDGCDPLAKLTVRQRGQLLSLVHQEPCSLQVFAGSAGLSSSAASAAVDKLVQMHLIRRVQNEENRRSILISLAPELKEKLMELERFVEQEVESRLTDYSPEEVRQLNEVCGKAARALADRENSK